jgi:endonuclease III
MAKAATKSRGMASDHGYPTPDRAALVAKALEVARRVTERHGAARFSERDPLSMLISMILSHRTRGAEQMTAYRALLDQFGSWEGVRDAPVAAVEAAIAPVNWPELKAPRIQATLRRITAERGQLNLDFLCDLPVEEGAAWLGRLEGVGPKTIACVLLFSCRKPILPVDVHVHRVSIRLGRDARADQAEAAHPLLQALLPDDAPILYNFHKGVLRHGQHPCVYGQPRCQECFLTDLCDHYQSATGVARLDETAPGPISAQARLFPQCE